MFVVLDHTELIRHIFVWEEDRMGKVRLVSDGRESVLNVQPLQIREGHIHFFYIVEIQRLLT